MNEGNYQPVERSYGNFSRSFTMPNAVKPENVTAEYKDGVLTLTMAKREEAKPKIIKRIQVADSEPQGSRCSRGRQEVTGRLGQSGRMRPHKEVCTGRSLVRLTVRNRPQHR